MSNQTYSTGLTKVNDTFLPMIENQFIGNGISMDGYSKQCVMNALSAINVALDTKGITFNDPQLDKNNLTTTLLNVAALKLNAAASPREVFFQVRNSKVKVEGKDVWRSKIEMGIEGDGNDAILNNFGRNVEQVRPFWLVRDGDDFEYPSFNGLEMTPPKWTPRGKGQVVRVVYPIIFKDNSIQYFIGEREDVAGNLIAHINNTMMNETFGICADRFNATAEQKKKISERKAEIIKKASDLGLSALDDAELLQWISPAWSEPQSRESMIIRKMRNNVVKKIPKDFGSAFVELLHNEATDDGYKGVRQEIAENANQQPIDVTFEAETITPNQQEPAQEPVQERQVKETQAPPPPEGDPLNDQAPPDRGRPNF